MEALTKDELLSVLAAAREHSQRDHLMILMAYCHGLRASEVVALTKDSVRDGHITVARLKGSLRTTQPLISDPDPLLNEAFAFFAYVPKSKRLFPITRQHFHRLFQRYGEAAGIPQRKRHPHVLKHTIAMQVIDGVGIQNTRQYLGHKSIASTGAYLKVSDQVASSAVQAALQK